MKKIPVVKQLNPGRCLTYLVYSGEARVALLVDPLLERVHEYLSLLGEKKIRLGAVLDTHSHDDHASASLTLAGSSGSGSGCEFLMHASSAAEGVTRPLGEGMVELVPGIVAEIVLTPGHTRDSICIVLDGALFTGDTLWLDEGCAGRDDGPGGDPGAHFLSLQRLKELSRGYLVLPGHEFGDSKPSTIGMQMDRNPLMKIGTRAEYEEYLEKTARESR